MPRLLPSSGSRRDRAPRVTPRDSTHAGGSATSGVPGALRALGVRPSRRLGQNFLMDPRVAERIASLVEDPNETVVEIGPGLGALTERLLARRRSVVAVELDARLAEALELRLAANGSARVVRGDVLDQRLEQLVPGPARVTIVANLPYSITTPAIEWVLAQGPRVRRAFLMVQREVADRMTATPGGKEFGSLAVFLALHAEVEPMFRVSPGAFHPRPDVDSVVVQVTPRSYPGTTEEERARVERLARAATTGRRKTVANALARGMDVDPEAVRRLLIRAGIDPVRRGETLSVDEWLQLARVWSEGDGRS
ncbi:MAG TPA: 16S rRNA (adenine(1518)-N(6)/adenine(1519)-N(6))-dimethyltransferase RsmA [Candidatus Eisenbacteria bacterium]|nr:16S rRNA (adenine(1518)-N(6)/adenine(1519)-N(6))-dimethyltransferase RsmA [Candidatus Eisenbacteria bacterium]